MRLIPITRTSHGINSKTKKLSRHHKVCCTESWKTKFSKRLPSCRKIKKRSCRGNEAADWLLRSDFCIPHRSHRLVTSAATSYLLAGGKASLASLCSFVPFLWLLRRHWRPSFGVRDSGFSCNFPPNPV